MLFRRKIIVLLTVFCLGLVAVSLNHYTTTNSDNSDNNSANGLSASRSRRLKTTTTTEDPEQEIRNAIRKHQQQKIQEYVRFKKPHIDENNHNSGDTEVVTHKANNMALVEESTPPVITSDGSRYIPHHRVFHLDLKGAPPKLSYIRELFPLIRDAGATAVLLEYEDMFPFWGSLRNVSAKNAYSHKDIQNIQKWASQNDLMIIPLVQTFGHLEFVLKLEEFKEVREVPMYPQALCPSQDKSWNIVKEIIDQVRDFSHSVLPVSSLCITYDKKGS